jgi:hypothetical protein
VNNASDDSGQPVLAHKAGRLRVELSCHGVDRARNRSTVQQRRRRPGDREAGDAARATRAACSQAMWGDGSERRLTEVRPVDAATSGYALSSGSRPHAASQAFIQLCLLRESLRRARPLALDDMQSAG